MFFSATGFISKNINKIFYSATKNGETHALDIDRYKFVAKKLNIVVNTEKESATSTQAVVPATITTAPEVNIDKSSVTIIVKNSTTKKGAATTVSKLLEDAGFQKPKTGNETKKYATTTVLVKEGFEDFGPAILDIVRGAYPDAISSTTTPTDSTDITIIIGVK